MPDRNNTKRWEIYPKIDETANAALSDYPQFFRQLLFNRGICSAEDARAFLIVDGELADPFLLLGLEKTIARLITAIDTGEKIIVYGDYDVDGVTATVMMVEVMQRLGGIVEPYIPNRFEEGYGLNDEAIHVLAKEHGASVILTVDCGIRSPREAATARNLGVDLIISDHHYPKGDLPEGYAVVCPKQECDQYPYKDLAGVGVAFKIVQGLYSKKGMDIRKADEWLDLVALGTVADMLPLTGENRVMVARGLNRIRLGSRVGLNALIGVSGRDVRKVTATDIGFMLGPRLNAAGRMESALQAYELLVSKSTIDAVSAAQVLDNQNTERQKATLAAQEKAQQTVSDLESTFLITAFDSEYSSGIVGLVASKLVEKFHRPAVVGERLEDTIRASCRSINGFHITKALDECADLLVRHGGHEMAAGFTVKLENEEKLVARLQGIAARELGNRDLRPTLKADLEIELNRFRPEYYGMLEQLQPTGMGNPAPLFVTRGVKVERMQVMGKEGSHLSFSVQGSPINRAVAFNQASWYQTWFEERPRFDIAYNIDVNHYNGMDTLQLNIRDMKISAIGF
ncbi:MAG TPA: single-stranded-DNA-specific exonuclease RecJ [Anaerolineaceae bacterium]|nr:single-stranded-DNA-specific exonuclease RecJ [Anaerolineaceae bacterium]